MSLKTHLLAPRQSGFWIGCLDALKLPKRCEKVAVIRRWALGGGSYSWEKDIVGMWRLLKVNRCWESSRCKEKTIFKTLAAAVPQKKNRPLISTWTEYEVFKMMTLEVYAMIMDILDAHINCWYHNVCSLCRINARS